jgi:hypothetical protein
MAAGVTAAVAIEPWLVGAVAWGATAVGAAVAAPALPVLAIGMGVLGAIAGAYGGSELGRAIGGELANVFLPIVDSFNESLSRGNPLATFGGF